LAFKDVGARFMARMLGYFNNLDNTGTVNVLVATSGDTGSAVANGFLNVPGVHVYVLYPKGKVSKLQEMQFATLGANITALEIDGTFDDCQAMVKQAFVDPQLNKAMKLTSANSINPARFLPQMFYYFGAIAQLQKQLGTKSLRSLNAVVSVPSGNLGNICSALIGARMGLPISRFVAANNANDVFTQYLNSGEYSPRPSVQTIANAMDVGAPSNFARIMDLYQSNHGQVASVIAGRRYSDDEIRNALREVEQRTGYQLDPHGATAYMALKDELKPGENGIFLETAHPAKFKETVESAIGQQIDVPERLAKFMERKKQSIYMPATFSALKKFLLTR
jgi:threonine synthase